MYFLLGVFSETCEQGDCTTTASSLIQFNGEKKSVHRHETDNSRATNALESTSDNDTHDEPVIRSPPTEQLCPQNFAVSGFYDTDPRATWEEITKVRCKRLPTGILWDMTDLATQDYHIAVHGGNSSSLTPWLSQCPNTQEVMIGWRFADQQSCDPVGSRDTDGGHCQEPQFKYKCVKITVDQTVYSPGSTLQVWGNQQCDLLNQLPENVIDWMECRNPLDYVLGAHDDDDYFRDFDIAKCCRIRIDGVVITPAPSPSPTASPTPHPPCDLDTGAVCGPSSTCFQRTRGNTTCNLTTGTCYCNNPSECVHNLSFSGSREWSVCRPYGDVETPGDLQWLGMLVLDILDSYVNSAR